MIICLHVFELLADALNECERAVKGLMIGVLGFFMQTEGGRDLHYKHVSTAPEQKDIEGY